MPRLNRHLLEQVLDISTWGESEDLVKGYPVYTAQFSLQKPQVEIKCYCPTEFPVFPPKVFVALSSGESFELPVQWQSSSDIDPEHQLGLLIKEQLLLPVITLNTAPLKSAICYGITNSKIAVTDNKEIAQKQGWQAIYSQNRTLLNIQDEYFARSGGILSKILNEKCVAIFGCGSGGSYIAEQLVRSGLGELVLCDMDRVEAHNLCRSGYEIQDLGVPKVNALSRKLRNINPSIKLELVNDDLMQL
ncbi:MAG: HesA/MoeB/ThiF family protein, partial [Phormidium sp.]